MTNLRFCPSAAALLVVMLGLAMVDVLAGKPNNAASQTPTSDTATVRAVGTVEPASVADVGAQVTGRIVSLGADARGEKESRYQGKSIDFGSYVKAGTVLARIDHATYAAQVGQSKAALAQSQAELSVEQAKLDLAKSQLERLQHGVGTPDIATPLLKVKIAEAAVAKAKAGIAKSQAMLKQAEIALDETVIRSPIDGVIIARRVNVGQIVAPAPSAPSLFLIAADMKEMQVWASVLEADIARIHEGMKASFTVDAFAKEVFQGTVTQVRLNASMVQNAVTYTVVIEFKNPDRKLMPYMTANVQFHP
jgi:HlyD family secretion protein